MSIINDALKKAAKEQTQKKTTPSKSLKDNKWIHLTEAYSKNDNFDTIELPLKIKQRISARQTKNTYKKIPWVQALIILCLTPTILWGWQRISVLINNKVSTAKSQYVATLPTAEYSIPANPGKKFVHPINSTKQQSGKSALPAPSHISLNGIMYSEAAPLAIINGKIVEEGTLVNTYLVTKITADYVELRYGDKTKILRIK